MVMKIKEVCMENFKMLPVKYAVTRMRNTNILKRDGGREM